MFTIGSLHNELIDLQELSCNLHDRICTLADKIERDAKNRVWLRKLDITDEQI